jgi:hypothetical protein
MKVNCRLSTPSDINKLITLWNENAEWGEIDREQWEKVFYHTPFGPSTIVLATDSKTDNVLAQFVFIPMKALVQGTELKVFRPFAPIVKKSVREEIGMLTLFHYIFKMYRFAVRHFITEGVDLLYVIPDPRWARSFQLVPGLKLANFPLWCLPLVEENLKFLPNGYAIEDISPSDPRMNELWIKTSKLHDCSIIRDATCFPWKLSHRDYRFLGVTNNEKLFGFAVFLYKNQDKGILICDVLAESKEAFRITLQAACIKAYAFKCSLPEAEQPVCEKVSILATPLIQTIAEDLGFQKNTYKFSLGVHMLSKKLPKDKVKPESWYVSAND